MKIGLDAKRAFCTTAGLGQFSRNHIRMALTHAPDNQYVLFTPFLQNCDFFEEMKKFPNVQVIQNNSLWPHALWRKWKVAALANQMQLDLFHGLSNELPHGLKMPACLSLHDLIPFYDENFTPIYQLWIYKAKMKHAVKYAQSVVCVSRFTKTLALETFPGLAENFRVIPPVLQSQIQTADLPAACPFKNRPYLLYLGTLGARKNLGNLLEAMQILAEKSSNIALVLAGKKIWFSDSLVEFVRNMQLEDRVFFTGEISETEKAGYMSHAKGLVYPSYIEGFGLPVLEAIAAGKNVAISKDTAMEEAAGNVGFRFHPQEPQSMAEALEALVQSPDLDENMRSHHLQQFSPERLWEQWRACYQECAQQAMR